MGWLSGWQYRKSHAINSASGAGTNYQVKVIAHYGNGTDSGGDVYLNGHCRTDFGDVRFTDDDGSTLLDYWMESKADGDYAIFWVEVADDLSTNPATIYIYYGNPTATTTSNGANTFLLFDDFADYSAWTRTALTPYGTGTDGTLAIETDSGVNVVSQSVTASGANKQEGLRSNSLVPALNKAIETRTRIVSPTATGTAYDGHVGYAFLWIGPNNYVMMTYYTRDGVWDLFKCVNGTVTHINTSSEAISNVFRRWTLVNSGTTFKIIIDGVQKVSGTITDFSEADRNIGIYDYAWRCADEHLHTDWIAVRKYVDPEPSHGSWGSEETAGGGETYEIYLDAISQALATPAYETTYNISKDASVTSQSLHAPQTTFNIPKDAVIQLQSQFSTETTFNVLKDALVQALAEAVVEKVVGAVIEIFQDAIATSQATFTLESTFNLTPEATAKAQATVNLETIFNLVKDAIIHASATPQISSIYPINKDALVNASATPSLQQTLGISKDAITVAVSTPLIQSTFNLSPEATVKVLAEVTIIKPTEIKVTKLFLLIGDLAIQIQG